jgi:hypothetical protein
MKRNVFFFNALMLVFFIAVSSFVWLTKLSIEKMNEQGRPNPGVESSSLSPVSVP